MSESYTDLFPYSAQDKNKGTHVHVKQSNKLSTQVPNYMVATHDSPHIMPLLFIKQLFIVEWSSKVIWFLDKQAAQW